MRRFSSDGDDVDLILGDISSPVGFLTLSSIILSSQVSWVGLLSNPVGLPSKLDTLSSNPDPSDP